MASGPHWEKNRGSYRVQWFDGHRWRRTTVYKVPGWKKGQPEPKKVPPEAQARVLEFAEKERAARASKPVDPTTTVADFLADYRAVYSKHHADGSDVQLAQAIGLFLRWCKEVKATKLDAITPSACQRFLDWRAVQISRKTKEPISPATMNAEKRLLSRAWSRAARLGEIPSNPWKPTAVPGWDRHRKKKKHRPAWTPEQFDKLLKVCRPWLRDVLILGTQTGLRINALRNLEWRDIVWAKDGNGLGSVIVRPELDKAGRGYTVPMSSKCHELLSVRSIHGDEKYVLSGARGGRLRGGNTFISIDKACKRAGLPDAISPNHMMRRSFGRWAVLGQLIKGKSIPMYVVMRWLGHSEISTTQQYLDLEESDSQDWMAGDQD